MATQIHAHVRDEADDNQQKIFQSGTDVGKLARDLFPGGIDASPVDPFHYQQSVADTTRYIKQGHTIIYEACFQFDGILCAMDILVKEKDGWVAYEVKSTTSVKPVFLPDAALQYYVISNSGITLTDIFIIHLNNTYIKKGELEIEKLFHRESVLERITNLQSDIIASYDQLQISKGMDASPAFYNLVTEPDAEKALATRQALLKYCELDTFAMVKLLEKLYTCIR